MIYLIHILNTSWNRLDTFSVYIASNPNFDFPQSSNKAITFNAQNHSEYGECIKTQIPYRYFNSHQIYVNNKSNEEFSLSTFNDENEKYFQLIVNTSKITKQNRAPQNTCFLIDYDKNLSNQTAENLLKQIAENYTNNIIASDSFNVFYTSLPTAKINENWMPATLENIENAFSTKHVSNYSNLIQLLSDGIQFVNANTGNNKIVLITNNNSFNTNVNELVNDIKKNKQQKYYD